MVILNDQDTPTRLPFNPNTRPTSLDISFCSPDLAARAQWGVSTDYVASDHLPVVVRLQLGPPDQVKTPRTFLNDRKANWTAFTSQGL